MSGNGGGSTSHITSTASIIHTLMLEVRRGRGGGSTGLCFWEWRSHITTTANTVGKKLGVMTFLHTQYPHLLYLMSGPALVSSRSHSSISVPVYGDNIASCQVMFHN